MKKELYTAPEMEIVKFDFEDVIVTSGGSGSIDEGEGSIEDL